MDLTLHKFKQWPRRLNCGCTRSK